VVFLTVCLNLFLADALFGIVMYSLRNQLHNGIVIVNK
jgi:hypothetical protein